MNAPLRDTSVEPVAELFAEHGNLVYRTLQYLGVPSALVDDALQDVFITAHRRWDSFDGRASARSWLYGIARRVAWRYRRNHQNRGARFILTERSVEGVDAPFEREHARRSVQALLESLDEDKRAAFVLTEIEGFTAAEAAELLEIPLGTVYSRVRAAWGKLRSAAQADLALDDMRVEMEPERSSTVQRAVLAACLPAAGPGVAVATTGLGSLGWVWGAVAAGAVAVGIGALQLGSDDPELPAPEAIRVQDDPKARAVGQPAHRTPAGAVEPERAAEPEPEPEAEPEAAPKAEPLPVVRRHPTTPSSEPTPQAKPDDAPLNTLAAEAKLIRRAKERVRDGKTEEARALLEEHERRFPGGQLADEREEVRSRLGDGRP